MGMDAFHVAAVQAIGKNPDDKVPGNSRGYSYRDNVSEKGAIFREGNEPSVSNNYAGFRPVLW